ncbi:MAG: dihydrodipicolinate synthase family protein [Geminicoccaceae bacterium]|nr:dihydrodipicolinate synthase family protein [Geminicoccaceae bacterium]MDW8370467.1 dihydrodipicolinate synthase family protein [Geminicoccaceae bacterium]
MPTLTGRERGLLAIAATPFDAHGALDLEATDRLVEWYLERGARGLAILGQMGEAAELTGEEALAFVRRVLRRVAERVPVVVGATAPGLAATVALARAAAGEGTAGVLVAPPGSLRGDEAVLAWCRRLDERLEAIPWVLQDFPLAGGPPMSPGLIRAIAEACPALVTLKHEDWPGLDKITAIRAQEAAGARRLGILCGNGGLFLPHELARGADGAMTGFAFPEMLADCCRLVDEGRLEAALDLFDLYLPLLRYEQQPRLGLVVRKYLLWRRGALPSPTVRAFAPELGAATRDEIELLLQRLERALARRHG